MRRMTTTKQLNYIKDLEQVAEKGFQVGTYPEEIYIVPEENWDPDLEPQIVDGDFYWEWIETAIEEGDIDFEDHAFGANLYFNLPHLLEKYGLYETQDSPAYIIYVLNDTVTMPDSVVDFESLKAWMQSEDFIDAIDEVTYDYDEAMMRNDVAVYFPDDPADNIILLNGELKLNTYIVCDEGLGEEIVNATDPVGEPALKVENLQVENLETENLKFENIDINFFEQIVKKYPTLTSTLYNKYETGTIPGNDIKQFATECLKKGGIYITQSVVSVTGNWYLPLVDIRVDNNFTLLVFGSAGIEGGVVLDIKINENVGEEEAKISFNEL